MKTISKKLKTLRIILVLGGLSLLGVACSNGAGTPAVDAPLAAEAPEAGVNETERTPLNPAPAPTPTPNPTTCYRYAFVSDRQLGVENIFAADTCGRQQILPLTFNTRAEVKFRRLAFKPDGTRLGFDRVDESSSLILPVPLLSTIPVLPTQFISSDEIDAGDLGALTGDFFPSSPVFEPNGSRVAFVSNNRVVANANGLEIIIPTIKLFDPATGLREIVPNTTSNVTLGTPIWHPDSQRILFEKSDPTSPLVIHVHDLVTGATREILDVQSPNSFARPLSGAAPSLSPDGQTLAFSRRLGFAVQIFTCTLTRRVSAFGARDVCRNTQILTSEGSNFNPAFSADGQFIFFNSNRDGNREIYMMRPDGSEPRRLTDNLADEGDVAVHPQTFQIP